MEKKVQIEEAQTKFTDLLEDVAKGIEIILMDKHKAIARLVKIDSDNNVSEEDRWTSDDFNIELKDDS